MQRKYQHVIPDQNIGYLGKKPPKKILFKIEEEEVQSQSKSKPNSGKNTYPNIEEMPYQKF